MAKAKVVITGLKSIDRKLARLPYKVQGKVVRPAIRAGMKVMLAGVKAEVPVDTGLTKANVKLRMTPKKRIKKGARSSTISMDVSIEADGGLVKHTEGGRRIFYPAVVEYGSSTHSPNPFGHRALRKYGDRARKVTITRLKSGVAEAAKGA